MASKDIDIDYKIIMKNKIPLLINDEIWKRIFGNIKEKDILNQREELEKLLKEQKDNDIEMKRLKKEKRKTMAKILNFSHRVNNNNDNDSIEKLEECQKSIIQTNIDLEDLTFRAETIPSLIRQSNFELLKLTIKYAYGDLKSNGKELQAINKEIHNLRERLRELIEEKNNCDEKINETYSFLHGILGGKEMEKLDKDMLK